MIAYCLKKIENGKVFYETPEIKYFSTKLCNAIFYDNIEDVEEDIKYHTNRDKNCKEILKELKNKEYCLPQYIVTKVEINEITEIEL